MGSKKKLKSNDSIDSYLNQTCRWIYSREQRKSVRLELLSHIEESVNAKCERGVSRTSAIESVLHEMGSAKSLARQLGFTHRPLIFRIPFIAATLVLVMSLGLGTLIEMTSRYFKMMSIDQSKIINSHLERFLADEKSLSADPLFSFTGRLHDAGPSLNSKVSWVGSNNHSYEKFFPKNIPLDLPKEIQLKNFGYKDLGVIRRTIERLRRLSLGGSAQVSNLKVIIGANRVTSRTGFKGRAK